MATSSTQQTRSASEYQAAQSSLADALAVQVLAAWNALLDVQALKRTLPVLSAGIAALVHRYGSASAAVAADYYDSARAAAAVSGPYTVVPAQPADLDEVTANVRWATKGLWSAEPDVQPARVLTQGAAATLALNTGRDTIVNAVRGDRQARGWARHVEPGACSFCLLLGTRGAVYRSERTAAFQAHDHCRCQPEPVFTAYEPSAEMRHWQAVYRQAARAGSGKAVRDEFRRLVDAERADQGPARDEGTPHGG